MAIHAGETILQEETKAGVWFVTETKIYIIEKGTLDHIKIKIPFLAKSLGRESEDKGQTWRKY